MQRRLQLSASGLSSRQTIPEMKIDQGPEGGGGGLKSKSNTRNFNLDFYSTKSVSCP